MRLPLNRRTIGAADIAFALVVQQIGYALSTHLAPLEASVPIVCSGTLAMCIYVHFKSGLKPSRFNRTMWLLALRLALSNAVVGVTYLLAVQTVSIGAVATLVALGPMTVGLSQILLRWRTGWGAKHLLVRLVAVVGVCIFNQPFGQVSFIGIFWAAISAACAWNFMSTIGLMSEECMADQGVAIANVGSCIAITAVVLLLKGVGWASPSFLAIGGLAGLLILFVPGVLQNMAVDRADPRDLGVLYSLDSPIATLVGLAGAALGLMSTINSPSLLAWVGMFMVFLSSILVSRIGDPPRL